MRDYGKVTPKFWIGKTGKELRAKGQEAQLVGLYLLTSPHSNMLGLYYLPKSFIAHETGMTLQGASKGLKGCIEAGFCQYDDDSEMVWVIEMAHYQIAPRLSPNDKQCKGIQKAYDDLPENPFLQGFYAKYQGDFHMERERVIEGAPKGDTKPHRSQEQEQEQEQEQAQKQDQDKAVPAAPAAPAVCPVGQIFGWWQKVMNSPKSQLDDKRRKAINGALKNYTPQQVCYAIRGCAKSDFHMARGEHAGKTKHNDLGLILRDAAHIDKFLELDGRVKHPDGAGGAGESLEQQNERVLRELGMSPEGAPAGGDVIDMEAPGA